MTALTTVEQNADLIQFTEDKISLIKRTVAKNATDDEMDLFLHQAKRMGLDPLARQIHFQKYTSRNGVANVSFITTIDGYRLIADRTGKYAGNDEPVFDGRVSISDAQSYERQHAPAKASVTVYKIVGGHVRPFSASVYWEEYYPSGKKGHMWRKMPHVMLGKVAEAAALRKAFPADLSGAYTHEEMMQSNVINNVSVGADGEIQSDLIDAEVVEAEFVEPEPQNKRLFIQFQNAGEEAFNGTWDTNRHKLAAWLTDNRTKSSKDLTNDELQRGIVQLNARIKKNRAESEKQDLASEAHERAYQTYLAAVSSVYSDAAAQIEKHALRLGVGSMELAIIEQYELLMREMQGIEAEQDELLMREMQGIEAEQDELF